MTAEALKAGHEFEPVALAPVTRVQIAKFAGAVGDFNPIHVDEEFARASGLPSVIAHGPLSLSFLASALERWVPLAKVRRLNGRFLAMNPPGTTITCRGRVVSVSKEDGSAECELVAENEQGVVVTKATATVAL